MLEKFSDLANEIRSTFDEESSKFYEDTKASLTAELDARDALGAHLETIRRSKKLSQVQLARIAGLQQAEISRIEKGQANVTVSKLLKLASALDRKIVLAPSDSQ